MATLTYDQVVLQDQPRTYFGCQETSGSTISDESRFGNDASVTGSLSFGTSDGPSSEIPNYNTGDGSSTGWETGANKIFEDLTFPFTLEVWSRAPASTSSTTTYGRCHVNHPGETSTNYAQFLGLTTDGSNDLYGMGDHKQTSYHNFGRTEILQKDHWHHIVVVCNGATDRDLYVNGVLYDTDTTNTSDIFAGTATNYANLSMHKFLYNGSASNLWTAGDGTAYALYNYALSHDRIRVHHAVGRGYTDDTSAEYGFLTAGAPVSHYPLTETSGTSAADIVGANTMTHANSPTLSSTGVTYSGGSDVTTYGGALVSSYPLTISAILKSPASTSSSTSYCMHSIGNTGSANEYLFARFVTNGSNELGVGLNVRTGGTDDAVTYTPTGGLQKDVEYHCVFVFASATDRRVYINGALVTSDTSSQTFPTGTNSTRIGGIANAALNKYAGTHSDVAFMPHAMTTAEVREHYRAWRQLDVQTSFQDHILRDAPRIYAPLDETSGTAADNLANINVDGVHTGSPTLSSDGVTYNGTTQYTKFTTSNTSDIGSPQTWAAILRSPASTSSSTIYPFISSADEATTNNSMYIALATDGSNNLAARGFLNNAATNYTAESAAILTKDQDYFVHFVVASSTDRRLYVNGVLMATSTNSLAVPTVFDNYILGGQERSSGLQYFQGTIRKPAVYDRELTEDEIRDQVSAWQNEFIDFNTLPKQLRNDAPIAYLALDETSGTTAADSSPFENDFTHAGSPTLSVNGVTYDGTDDVTDIDTALIDAYPCTLMAVMKSPASTSVSTTYGWFGGADAGTDNNFFFVALLTDGSDNLYARCGIQTSGTTQHADSAAELPKDTYLMVHAVYTSATDRKIYVNGVEMGTNTTSLAFPSGVDNLSIGSIQRSTPVFYVTDIQAAAAFRHALSGDEVRDQVAAWQGNTKKYGRAVHKFVPVGYWRCNEGTGSTFADVSGWGNDLTVAGSPTLNGAGPLYNDSQDGAFGESDGSDDEASAAVTIPTPAYPFAISAWLKSPSSTSGNTAYARWHIGDDGTQNNTIAMDLLSDGSNVDLEARQLFQTGGTTDHVTSTKPKERNVFHHVLFVCRSATDRETYVNGKTEITDATSHSIGTSMDDVSLLRSLTASPTFVVGTISEASLHNHSFTDADALELYLASGAAQLEALAPMGTINETGTLDNILTPDAAKFISEDRSGEMHNIVMPTHEKATSSRQVAFIATSCGIIMEGRASVAFVTARTAEGDLSVIIDFNHAASFHTSKSGETGIIVDPSATKTENTDPGSTPATPVPPRYKFTPGRTRYIFTPPREGNDNEV